MTATVEHLHGVAVLVYPPDGPRLGEHEVLDVIGAAIAHRAELVSLPARRCPDGFFTLRTGVAGALLQKFANYRLRLAIVGDVSGPAAGSGALCDFVSEANRGDQVWFVPTRGDLAERLRRSAERRTAG